jgi:hypothetical protein
MTVDQSWILKRWRQTLLNPHPLSLLNLWWYLTILIVWRHKAEIFFTTPFNWPPLRSRYQSSWLQIQRSGFDFRSHQIFWEVVGLERGPLSLVSTIEELLKVKACGSVLENWYYCRRDLPRWPRINPLSAKLALTSPTRVALGPTQPAIE